MIDTFLTPKQHKDEKVQQTCADLAGKVRRWDDEIRLSRVWMAEKMVELGSWEALGEWMKSPDGQPFREYVERCGHRWHIGQLYRRLKDADIEDLKKQLK